MAEEGGEAIARAFIAASEEGHLPQALLTEDFSAWTTLQGDIAGSDYRHAIELMRQMTGGSLRFTVQAITAQDDRVVIETTSTARLVDGSDYANTYVFSLRVTDGRIAHVREHFNALTVRQTLIPLMANL